jgi:prevent-host-death family protein
MLASPRAVRPRHQELDAFAASRGSHFAAATDAHCGAEPIGLFLYKKAVIEVYAMSMDVAVSELRAHLSDYLDQAREGAEVVITDRGVPIARLLGLTATAILERLVADGVIARPAGPRPRAAGQHRPRPRRPVADLVSDQRR